MNVNRRVSGSHTACFVLPRRGYQTLQSIADAAYEAGYPVEKKADKYNLNHTFKVRVLPNMGIGITIKQFCTCPGNVKVKVAFGSLLSGEYDPMRLYQGGQWKIVRQCFREMLDIRGLPDDLEDYTLGRDDLTEDIRMSSDEEVVQWVRVFLKSMRSGKYHRQKFTKDSKRVNEPAEANRHSTEYCTATKHKDKKTKRETGIQPRTAFKAYDKHFEVADEGILSEPVLRLELTHTGDALRRKLKLKKSSNQKVLDAAASQAEELIWSFVESSMFVDGRHLRFDDAISLIRTSPEIKDKHRAEMEELVRKCSDKENLYRALDGIGKKHRATLLKWFKKVNLSPISLPNDCAIRSLPSIRELLGKVDGDTPSITKSKPRLASTDKESGKLHPSKARKPTSAAIDSTGSEKVDSGEEFYQLIRRVHPEQNERQES